jgi:hypothetical protein
MSTSTSTRHEDEVTSTSTRHEDEVTSTSTSTRHEDEETRMRTRSLVRAVRGASSVNARARRWGADVER